MEVQELDMEALENKSKEEILSTLENAMYSDVVEQHNEQYTRKELMEIIKEIDIVNEEDVRNTISKPGIIKLLMFCDLLPKTRKSAEGRIDYELMIKDFLVNYGEMDREELAKLTGLSNNQVDNFVERLSRKGEVFYPETEVEGTKEQGYKVALV